MGSKIEISTEVAETIFGGTTKMVQALNAHPAGYSGQVGKDRTRGIVIGIDRASKPDRSFWYLEPNDDKTGEVIITALAKIEAEKQKAKAKKKKK